MTDFHADLSTMDTAELLEHQQAITRTRLEAIEAGRRAQAEIDRRAAQRAEERAAEDEALGAVRKPPAQQVFGSAEVGADG